MVLDEFDQATFIDEDASSLATPCAESGIHGDELVVCFC